MDLNGIGSKEILVVFGIIFVGCIFLVISGAKAKRRIKRFKQYVSLISNEKMNTLEKLASATSQSVDFVKNDLQTMISKKFFADAFINLKTGEIVIGNHTPSKISENVKIQPETTREIENVKCPGCGALNSKSKGIAGNCDYCGTLLK